MAAWLDRPYLNADCDAASGRDAYLAGLAGITEIEVIESHPCGCRECAYHREEWAKLYAAGGWPSPWEVTWTAEIKGVK